MDMKLIALNVLVRDASGFVCFFFFFFIAQRGSVHSVSVNMSAGWITRPCACMIEDLCEI